MLKKTSSVGSLGSKEISRNDTTDTAQDTISTAAIHPARDISKYQFFEKLGEGSYGKVRLVKCTSTNRYYALKYMPKFQQTSKIRTFIRERRVLAELHHPLICRLEAAFHNNNFLFLVLEHMECGDLRQYLQRYTFSEAAIKIITAQVACALTYIHDNGFVHRDIKPENILIGSNGNAHICDFNITIKLSVDDSVVHGFSGTFFYQAPEIHEHLPYTEQADWWALGCVFYEMVYGRLPFKSRTSKGMVHLMSKGIAMPSTYPAVTKSCKEAVLAFLKLTPCYRVKNADEVFGLEFFEGLTRSSIEADASDLSKKSPVLELHKMPQSACVAETEAEIQSLLDKEFLNWKRKKLSNPKGDQSKVKVSVRAIMNSSASQASRAVASPKDGSKQSTSKFRCKDRLRLYGQIINRQLKRLAVGDENVSNGNSPKMSLEHNGSSTKQSKVISKASGHSDDVSKLQTDSPSKTILYKDFDYLCTHPVLKSFNTRYLDIPKLKSQNNETNTQPLVSGAGTNISPATSFSSGSATVSSTRANSGEMSLHKRSSGSLSSVTSEEDYLPKGVIARGRAGKGSRVRIITEGKNRSDAIHKECRHKADVIGLQDKPTVDV